MFREFTMLWQKCFFLLFQECPGWVCSQNWSSGCVFWTPQCSCTILHHSVWLLLSFSTSASCYKTLPTFPHYTVPHPCSQTNFSFYFPGISSFHRPFSQSVYMSRTLQFSHLLTSFKHHLDSSGKYSAIIQLMHVDSLFMCVLRPFPGILVGRGSDHSVLLHDIFIL